MKTFIIHLSNGERFADLTFKNAAQVRRLFKGCRIKGANVYLGEPK